MTDLDFPRVRCSPVEMCAVDSNFPRVSYNQRCARLIRTLSPVELSAVKVLHGTTGLYKAGFGDGLASVYADCDWVAPLRISPNTCTDMVSLPPAEAYTVQVLMDLALLRFAGLGDGTRQVHAPWAMSTDSPASPPASRLDTSGEMDREWLRSPCFDLDGFSSSDDDIGTLGGLSDISVTLLRDDDEVFSHVNSDQVLSDVDFPPEPGSHDKRQVVRRCDASPDILPVAAPPVRRTGDPRRSIARVPPDKRMPGEVSMTIYPVPPSFDMTVACASGVVPMPTQPLAVTTVPAMSTATATSREVDVRPGPSRVQPHARLGPASTLLGEGVPAVVLPFTPRSVPPILVPRGGGGPAVPPSVPPDYPTPSPSTSSGQSATPSSQMMAWGGGGCELLVGILVPQSCPGGTLSRSS